MNLIGEYPVAIDEKGRLRLPSALLRQLPAPEQEEAGYEFVVNRGFERCLTLYPKPVWESITARINKLNRFNERNRSFIRSFYLGAYPMATDNAGRILLQKPLMDYAGIGTEISLLCMSDRIEIWAADQQNQLNFNPNDFSDLADLVLGGGESGVGEIDVSD
jgi:MraZ protein